MSLVTRDLVHRRDAPPRVLGDLLEAPPVLLEQPAVEIGRDAVEAAGALGQEGGSALALVSAHHQAASVLAVVDEQVGVAQRGQPALGPVAKRLRHQVLMGHGDHGHAHAGHAPDLGRVHAGGVDDHLGLDLAALRADALDPAVIDLDPRDAGVREHLSAAGTGPVGERVGELRGVEVAVGRQPGRPPDALGRHQRKQLTRLVGRDQLHRQAEGLRPARLTAKLLEALVARGEADAAALDPTRIVLGLGSQAPVEVDRVHHHLGQGDGVAKLADEPGGVEGRPGGELGALEQDDVVPTELGEVVGNRGPADAATDDHAARRVREVSSRAHSPREARCRNPG